MTDSYPPFRLDMGGHEPAGALTVPPPASAPPGPGIGPWRPEQAGPGEQGPAGSYPR
jgi:hypothetical protein